MLPCKCGKPSAVNGCLVALSRAHGPLIVCHRGAALCLLGDQGESVPAARGRAQSACASRSPGVPPDDRVQLPVAAKTVIMLAVAGTANATSTILNSGVAFTARHR